MTNQDVIEAMELSALAYKDTQPYTPGEVIAVIDDERTDVQCYIRRRGAALYITFRGTDSVKDGITDLKCYQKVIPYGNTSSKIKVHAGFIGAYKNPALRCKIHSMVTPDIHCIRVCGHSYGAALAVLCAVDLEYNFPHKDYEVFLFGCPRVGNRAFQKSYNKRVFKTIRVENGNDLVTKVPPILLGYRHVGIRIHIGSPRMPLVGSVRNHDSRAYYARLFKRLSC